MQAVAEGVETQEQLELLCSMNCDAAQGYYWARPLDTERALEALASQSFASEASREWRIEKRSA